MQMSSDDQDEKLVFGNFIRDGGQRRLDLCDSPSPIIPHSQAAAASVDGINSTLQGRIASSGNMFFPGGGDDVLMDCSGRDGDLSGDLREDDDSVG